MIIKTVAKFYNLTVEEIKSKTRRKEVVGPRQVAMFLSKEHTKHSLKAIGYHYGGRDHATVIHAVKCIQDAQKTTPKVSDDIKSIRAQLKGKR